MRRQDFTYTLPPALIAQQPLAERSASRLLSFRPWVRSRIGADRAVEAGRAQQRLEVGGQVVAAQHVHRVGHPDVLGGVVTPEVLVGVEAHGL